MESKKCFTDMTLHASYILLVRQCVEGIVCQCANLSATVKRVFETTVLNHNINFIFLNLSKSKGIVVHKFS